MASSSPSPSGGKRSQRTATGLILSRQWRDRREGQSVVFWLATDVGPARVEITNQESVLFVERSDMRLAHETLDGRVTFRHKELPLHSSNDPSETVGACYFRNQRDLGLARSLLGEVGIGCFEADLRPTDRYLMERFVKGVAEVRGVAVQRQGYLEFRDASVAPASHVPRLKVTSLDIETSISSGEVLSIAMHTQGVDEEASRKVFMVGEAQPTALEYLEYVPDEVALLRALHAWFAHVDPDVVIGWSVVDFDLRHLQERCDTLGLKLLIGRDSGAVAWRRADRGGDRHYAVVPGRVFLDGIALLRTATYSFESFSLENVARELLGRGKLIEDADARAFEIETLFQEDKEALAKYNLEDCVLVSDIFEKTNLLDFAVQRSQLTGLDMDRQGGSVAAFDYLYLPRLHREGYVAPVVRDATQAGGPGGHVLESMPGLYSDVVVMDFKSLYPSIIRTFLVDPLGMIVEDEARVPGFLGASFSKHHHLLPGIIEELWAARDAAKKAGRTAESTAIKIIMNSFYGVLGTPGCRFFDPRLVSSITLRGHEILRETRDLIEHRGFKVIYGDTDSVFVLMDQADEPRTAAARLVTDINRHYREELKTTYGIDSFLEIEMETHFARFLMPRVRGSDKGSKKRYAGMVAESGDLVFKGLESVRSDWSPLAREFQQELYRRVFLDEPVEPYIRETVERVRGGESDDKLVLRKRLRRRLDDYVRNEPPHVRAARTAEKVRRERGLPPEFKNGGVVEYVMTTSGAEPTRYRSAAPDYEFYIERQLAPIADAVLVFADTNLATVIDSQMTLF